jgi:hypothetical protein
MGSTQTEKEALDAMDVAAKALARAIELSEAAGFGSMVLGPLADAQRNLVYARDTAEERN